MVKQFFIYFFVFANFWGLSQEKTLNLSFKQLSPDKGLSQSTNAYVFKDSRGFVWISSLDGLNRFDGIEVKVYKPKLDDKTSLLGRNITSQFHEDRLGNLWFTTHEAINCYQRATDNFRSFQLKDSLGIVIKEDYYAFHFDESTQQFWLRTSLGDKGRLHIFNISTKKDRLSYPLDGQRCNVILNETGEVKKILSSMLHNRPGIEVLDLENDGKRKSFLLNDIAETANFRVFSRNVLVENDTLAWIGSNIGLIAFNPEVGNIIKYYEPYFQDEFVGTIWSIIPFEKNLLFVGTFNGGLLLFDKKQRKFVEQYKAIPKDKNSIPDNKIMELYLDNHSNLWVSQYEKGLVYANLYKQKFTNLAAAQGQRIYALYENKIDSSVWIGFENSLAIIKNGKNYLKIDSIFSIELGKRLPFTEPCSQIFQDAQKDVWILSGRRIAKYNKENQRFELLGEYSGKAFFYTLNNGTTLSAIIDGIVAFNNGRVETEYYKVLGNYKKGFYTHIFEDNEGRLYLAENGANLLIFSKKDKLYQLDTSINEIGYCHHFFEEPQKQLLWVATSTGLLKIHIASLAYERLTEKENNLSNEVFHAVFPDLNNLLWLSSNRGILRYNSTGKTIHRYTIADGLQGNEFTKNVAIQSSNGEIWMGGNNGLNVFTPTEIQNAIQLPEIQFTNLFINDELSSDSNYIGELTELNLEYEQNTISLEFAALEYSDAPNNQFKYQLSRGNSGTTNNWIDNKNRGFIRFPNLSPGDYELKIKAANSDGFWNEIPKVLLISVAPPFWRTWWFYLLCLLLISTIIYVIFKYRLEQALKVERMRVKISSDLHDDVGGLLSGLAMQSEILELTAKAAEKPKLRRISELSRSAMSRMRDTVWAIDARKDEFEHLLDRMREHAEETLMPKEFRYEINTKNINLKSKLPTEVRQNLYLIYKEAITNIAKHSNGNTVKVVLENKTTHFEMRIRDNGKVNPKKYKTTGLGLSNMKMRAKQIKATIEISTEKGYETALSFSL